MEDFGLTAEERARLEGGGQGVPPRIVIDGVLYERRPDGVWQPAVGIPLPEQEAEKARAPVYHEGPDGKLYRISNDQAIPVQGMGEAPAEKVAPIYREGPGGGLFRVEGSQATPVQGFPSETPNMIRRPAAPSGYYDEGGQKVTTQGSELVTKDQATYDRQIEQEQYDRLRQAKADAAGEANSAMARANAAASQALAQGRLDLERAQAYVQEQHDRIRLQFLETTAQLEQRQQDITQRGQSMNFGANIAATTGSMVNAALPYLAPPGTAEDIAGGLNSVGTGVPYNYKARPMQFPYDPTTLARTIAEQVAAKYQSPAFTAPAVNVPRVNLPTQTFQAP